MIENMLHSDVEKIHKRIFNYQDESVEKILIFLDNFLSDKIQEEDIIFNYCNEICIKKTNSKILLGKLLIINQKNKNVTIASHKEYIPYYNETNIIERYNFKELDLIDFIDLLIIKFIKYTNMEEKKLDGIYNFPKYVIMKSKDSQVKQKICKQLDMTDKGNFTYEKYIEIIEKYKILLMEFYKAYAKQNNKFM